MQYKDEFNFTFNLDDEYKLIKNKELLNFSSRGDSLAYFKNEKNNHRLDIYFAGYLGKGTKKGYYRNLYDALEENGYRIISCKQNRLENKLEDVYKLYVADSENKKYLIVALQLNEEKALGYLVFAGTEKFAELEGEVGEIIRSWEYE